MLKSILQAEEIAWVVGVVVAVLVTAVQKLSTKYKPWSWIAKQLGKAINAEVLERQEALENKVDNLEKMDKKQDESREKEKALSARRRILRFSDEIRRGDKHSEEYFNEVLDDITFYKNYCDANEYFENERAVLAIEMIEKTYKYCVDENAFL